LALVDLSLEISDPIFPNNFLLPNSHTKDEVVYHSSENNIYTKT